MASTVIFQGFSSPVCSSASKAHRHNYKPRTLPLSSSQLFPSKSFLKLKNKPLQSAIQSNNLGSRIYASQSNIFRELQTAYKTGNDAIEVGAVLVPDSVPRPIAKIAVVLVGGSIAISLFKIFWLTAFLGGSIVINQLKFCLLTAYFTVALVRLIFIASIGFFLASLAFDEYKVRKGGGDTGHRHFHYLFFGQEP